MTCDDSHVIDHSLRPAPGMLLALRPVIESLRPAFLVPSMLASALQLGTLR